MADDDTWDIGKLSKQHDRSRFTCGEAALDDYLKKFARQNDRRGIGRTFVATQKGSMTIVGYYTICSGAVEFKDIPEESRRRLPRYPVPVVHLARLAVDVNMLGKGLGETLLMHALSAAVRVSGELGVHAVAVTAKSDAAKSFYARYGFQSLLDDDKHMYIALAVAKKALS